MHQHLKKRHENPLELRILDVGCGTGLVGSELHKIGYRDLDGLDASPEMLKIAAEKNIFKSTFVAFIGLGSPKEDGYHQECNRLSGTRLPEKVSIYFEHYRPY